MDLVQNKDGAFCLRVIPEEHELLRSAASGALERESTATSHLTLDELTLMGAFPASPTESTQNMLVHLEAVDFLANLLDLQFVVGTDEKAEKGMALAEDLHLLYTKANYQIRKAAEQLTPEQFVSEPPMPPTVNRTRWDYSYHGSRWR